MNGVVTEGEVWEMINAAKCMSCGMVHWLDNDQEAIIHANVTMMEEWDGLIYEMLGDRCCESPSLIPVIRSDKGLFGVVVDDGYKVPAGPATPFRPALDRDTWLYEVDDDLLTALGIEPT